MSWIEITLETNPTLVEKCTQDLENLGALAVSYLDAHDQPLLEPLPGTTPLWNQVKVVGLFEQSENVNAIPALFEKKYPDMVVTTAELPDQEWTKTWMEHFHPIRFGNKLWVYPVDYPVDEQVKPEHIVMRLDPGLAFGTGTHPTTALCLKWLDQNQPVGLNVMDYGCGSGILGIAALLLGAKQVWAVDYDPQALTSTLDNLQKNAIDPKKCLTYLPSELPTLTEPVHLILANILANPLIELASTFAKFCSPGGKIVLSGLLQDQIELVKAAYLPWFIFASNVIQDDWVLLSATRIE